MRSKNSLHKSICYSDGDGEDKSPRQDENSFEEVAIKSNQSGGAHCDPISPGSEKKKGKTPRSKSDKKLLKA